MSKEKIILEEKFIDLECLSELENALCNDCSTSVFVGRCNSMLSAMAYTALEGVESAEGEAKYLVLSDGKDLAVAFERDYYESDSAGVCAIYSIIDYLSRGESFGAGTVVSGAVEPVSYCKSLDEKQNEKCYEKMRSEVGGKLGEEIAEATKEYFSMMSDGVVDWLSGLYDPKIGGFYYSASGRDHEGYLPDLESTGQALTILEYNNMLDHIGGVKNIPDFMKKQIISFVKPLQDSNGYFYHPQWTKERTDRLVERRARDLSYAVSALAALGALPTYDTPNGVAGDGLLIDGARVDPRGISPAPAKKEDKTEVQKPKERYISPILKDAESFKAYLEAGREKITRAGYSFGSEICSQASEIFNRDKQLRDGGADYSLGDILMDYLTETQNPKTGTWYSVNKGEEGYSDYAGVNALLKIGGLFTMFGREFPHSLEACRSAVNAIYSEENPLTMCYQYNAWFSVENIIKNLSSCASDPEWGRAKVEEIRKTLLADEPASIRKTAEKLRKFRKDDGSFSYFQTGSCCTSNEMWVAIKDTNEGDVNASVIGGIDVSDRMYFVLGLERPKILGRAAYCKFIYNIKNPKPIIKKPAPYEIPR